MPTAVFGDGVPRIHAQIHQHLFELGTVTKRLRQVRINFGDELDTAVEGIATHIRHSHRRWRRGRSIFARTRSPDSEYAIS